MNTGQPNELRRSTLLMIFGALVVGYWLSSGLIGSKEAIEIGNAMLVSAAMGIATAYAPVAWQSVKLEKIPGENILSIGIFLGGVAIAYRTGASIVWREVGSPVSWLNSPVWGFHLAVSLCSAVAHMIAPNVIGGAIPKREWIRMGFWVSAATMIVATTLALNLN